MSKQILAILKRKSTDLSAYGNISSEAQLNVFKEELQFFVLNFIYHHAEYSNWTMYGGSALRIIHGLDRMSVDLDFEVSQLITAEFLSDLKDDLESYFTNTYNVTTDFLTIKITNNRGLVLKFYLDEDLVAGNFSKQIHVKIDLNYFIPPDHLTEYRPINRGQFSFVIKTYKMSTLMASKLAAIFLRGTRGVGSSVYHEKGRDIYDLLWYMNKKILPNFDYLEAKGVIVKDPGEFFNKLTLQMNKVSDENLKQDLLPLFEDRERIENWLNIWRMSYFNLLDNYKVSTIRQFDKVVIHRDSRSDNYEFKFLYDVEGIDNVEITYFINAEWIMFHEGDLLVKLDAKLNDKIEFLNLRKTLKSTTRNKLKQYATLFYQKNERYLAKNNMVIIGDEVTTKLIRMNADNLNSNEQVLLNKDDLVECELVDLLK